MKRIKFVLPFLALALFSCSDYLDINTDPNNPDASLVSPDLALSSAQTAPYRTLNRTANILGNLWMNNWGFNVNSFAVTNPEEFSLTINTNTYAGIWDGLYVNTANLTKIINYPSDDFNNHKAIAKITKAFYFQYLVDLYGDIPYTEVHQGSANLTPAYDDDMAIYRDLVVQLEDAINTIDNPTSNTMPVGQEDVVNGGNMQLWKEFANTLKLRILLRQSEMTDAETQSYLAAEFAELAGAEFVDQDITINPGYSSGEDNEQNPFYNLMYELDEVTEKTIYRQYRASDHFADNLNTNPVDPRRGRIFVLISGNVVGVAQGDSSQNSGGTAPSNLSGLGSGVLINSAQDGYMMTLAESKLLQAEAALRGFIAGDAAAMFNEAIAASFNILGAGDPSTYITTVDGTLGKGLGAGSLQDKLNAIQYQKNIALTGINAIEAFIDATRTGYIDTIPLAWGATQPNKPRKLLYPNSEYVGNAGNVPTQTQTQVFTEGAFWFVP